MNKIKYFGLVVCSVIMMLVVVGCNKATTDPVINNVLNNDVSTLAFTSLSSAKILSNKSTQLESRMVRRVKRLVSDANEIDMTKVNEYLQMMESMFADNGPLLINEFASDRAEFEIKMEFATRDLSGNETKYLLYLNQELDAEELENNDDDNEFDEQEEEYRLSGIAVIDDIEYNLVGKKELEENEAELEIKISLDQNNYVVIKQEIEQNEVELKYKIVKEGKKFSTFSFEVEDEKEFKASFKTMENGYKETYNFYKEEGKIKIKYVSPELVYVIHVNSYIDAETGETIYEYHINENDKTYKFEK